MLDTPYVFQASEVEFMPHDTLSSGMSFSIFCIHTLRFDGLLRRVTEQRNVLLCSLSETDSLG